MFALDISVLVECNWYLWKCLHSGYWVSRLWFNHSLLSTSQLMHGHSQVLCIFLSVDVAEAETELALNVLPYSLWQCPIIFDSDPASSTCPARMLSTWTSAVGVAETVVRRSDAVLTLQSTRVMNLTWCNYSLYAEGSRAVRYWWTWQRRRVLFDRLILCRLLFTLSVCPKIPLMTW